MCTPVYAQLTGADGIMTAESVLDNPAIYASLNDAAAEARLLCRHGYRHVHRHKYGHVYRLVCRHAVRTCVKMDA